MTGTTTYELSPLLHNPTMSATRNANLCRSIAANPHRRSCVLHDGQIALLRYVELHEDGAVVFIVHDEAGCGRKIPAELVREIV